MPRSTRPRPECRSQTHPPRARSGGALAFGRLARCWPRNVRRLAWTASGGRQPPLAFGGREMRGGDVPLLAGSLEHLRHIVPIDHVIDKGLEIVGPAVAIVDVIGMLPHVAPENGLRAVHQRAFAVRRLAHDDLA